MTLPHDHNTNAEKLLSAIPCGGSFETVSGLFRQLADPVRVKIMWLLCHTEECVLNIAAMAGMSSPAVVHHLKLLKEAGLIESRKEGKEVYYKATDTPEAAALHLMIEQLMEISCPETEIPNGHYSEK